VVLKQSDAADCPTNCLLAADPYLAYARLATLFDPRPAAAPGIHRTAVIADSARLGQDVSIGAHAVIGEHCVIGDGCAIGPGCVLEAACRLDEAAGCTPIFRWVTAPGWASGSFCTRARCSGRTASASPLPATTGRKCRSWAWS
jgi:hypothetical protein